MIESMFGILSVAYNILWVIVFGAGAYYLYKFRNVPIPFLSEYEHEIRFWLVMGICLVLGAGALVWMRATFTVGEQWHIGGAVLVAFVTIHLMPLAVWFEHRRDKSHKLALLRDDVLIGRFNQGIISLVVITLLVLHAAHVVEGDTAFMYQMVVGLVCFSYISTAYSYWAERTHFREVGDRWAKKRPFVTSLLILGGIPLILIVLAMVADISLILFMLGCTGFILFIFHSAWLKTEEEYLDEQKSNVASDLAVQIYAYLMNEYDILPDCKNIEENGDMIRIVLAMNGPEERARLGSWVCDDIRDQFGFGRVELACVSGGDGADTEEQIVLELRMFYKGE